MPFYTILGTQLASYWSESALMLLYFTLLWYPLPIPLRITVPNPWIDHNGMVWFGSCYVREEEKREGDEGGENWNSLENPCQRTFRFVFCCLVWSFGDGIAHFSFFDYFVRSSFWSGACTERPWIISVFFIHVEALRLLFLKRNRERPLPTCCEVIMVSSACSFCSLVTDVLCIFCSCDCLAELRGC